MLGQYCGPTKSWVPGWVGVEDLPVPAGILDVVVNAQSMLREKTRGTPLGAQSGHCC